MNKTLVRLANLRIFKTKRAYAANAYKFFSSLIFLKKKNKMRGLRKKLLLGFKNSVTNYFLQKKYNKIGGHLKINKLRTYNRGIFKNAYLADVSHNSAVNYLDKFSKNLVSGFTFFKKRIYRR
jgi:hypothetical protein